MIRIQTTTFETAVHAFLLFSNRGPPNRGFVIPSKEFSERRLLDGANGKGRKTPDVHFTATVRQEYFGRRGTRMLLTRIYSGLSDLLSLLTFSLHFSDILRCPGR
jgi:hypothetical protein